MITRADKLRYIDGYKYRTTEPYWVMCNLRPHQHIEKHRIHLTREGLFFLEAGYSSDGPSGPTIDTADFMPGATGWHDPMYELLRNEMLHIPVDIVQPESRPGNNVVYQPCPEKIIVNASHEDIRQEADRFLADILLLDGMWSIRVKWIYAALRKAGVSAAIKKQKEHIAP